MTCIIGYIENKKVYMGGDSCISWGRLNEAIGGTKIYHKGEYLIGNTGACADGDLMHHCFDPPKVKGGLVKFMLSVFAPQVKEFFKGYGRLKDKDGLQELESYFLIAVKGRVFWMDTIGGMNEVKQPYQSVGCGENFALGAMGILHKLDMTPEAKIKAALKVTAEHCAGVAAPFHVKSI